MVLSKLAQSISDEQLDLKREKLEQEGSKMPDWEKASILGSLLQTNGLKDIVQTVVSTTRSYSKLIETFQGRSDSLFHNVPWDPKKPIDRSCGEFVLLLWRYLWFERQLKTELSHAEGILRLLEFHDTVEQLLNSVGGKLSAVAEQLVKTLGITGIPMDYFTTNAPYRLTPVQNEGIFAWKNWAFQIDQKTLPLDRLGGFLDHYREFAGVSKDLVNASEKLWSHVSSDLAGRGQGVLGKFLTTFLTKGWSKAIAPSNIIGGLTNLKGLSLIGVEKHLLPTSALSGGIRGAANLVIDLSAVALTAIRDKKNLKNLEQEDLKIEDRFQLLQQLLNHKRLNNLKTQCGSFKDDLAKAEGAIQRLKQSSNKPATKESHAHAQDAAQILYRIYDHWHACLSVQRYVSMMVCELGQLMTQKTQEYEIFKEQMKLLLTHQITCNHSVCKGTCYGDDGSNRPILPVFQEVISSMNPY